MTRSPLRFASTVLYVVMAAWLVFAGTRRILAQLDGTTPPDFAAFTSVSLGLCGLALLVIRIVVRRRELRRAGA